MKRTDDARLWLGGGLVAAVLLVALGWLVLVHPKLAEASTVRAQAADQQVSNAALQGKVGTLEKQNKALPALVADLRRVRAQLPITADLSGFTDQVGADAATARVGVTSLTVAGATAVTTTTATAGAGATGTAATAAEPATAGTGTAAGAAAGRLFAVPVTVTTTGSLAQQRAFLSGLRAGPRAAVVTSAQLKAGTTAGGATPAGSVDRTAEMTTLLTVFVAPQTPADTAALNRQLNAKTVR